MPRPTEIAPPPRTTRVLVSVADGAERNALVRAFRRLGHDATPFTSADEAWQHMASRRYDIVYLDLPSRQLDAVALIQRLRHHPRSRRLPVVVLCAGDAGDALQAAFEAGAASYLLVPLADQIIPAHHVHVLRQARRSHGERLELAASEAGCKAREAFLAGACSEVTAYTRCIVETTAVGLRPSMMPEALTDAVKAAAAEAQMLGDLVVDVREKARRIGEMLVVADRPVRLERLIHQALAPQAGPARRRRVKVVTRPLPEGVQVLCEEEAVSLALGHLVANAIAAAPAATDVAIDAVVQPDGLLAISVTDAGAGMVPEFVARCLNPLAFDGALAIPRRRIGSGLPVAKAIAEAHGGRLEIRTFPGEGTTALMTLPPERVVVSMPVRRQG